MHGSNVSTIAAMSYTDAALLANASRTANATQGPSATKPMDPETYAAIAQYADPTQYRDVDYQAEKWYDYQPRIINGDGDGTVNMRSLHGCRQLADRQKQRVYCQEFPGEDHFSIISSDELKSYLSSVLS